MSAPAYLEIAGRRLEYAWHGPAPAAAPTLVFLHEGLGSLGLWRDFPAKLAAATGCGALVYSRAGYGASDPVALPRPLGYMHEEALGVLPAVLAATGVGEHILVGHSDGASIAVINAGGAPRAGLCGIILEAPHVFTEDMGIAAIAAAGAAYRDGDLRPKLGRWHGGNIDNAFWGWHDVWCDPAFRRWNIENYLPGIAVPGLLIQGEDDQYGTIAQVEAVRRRSGAPVRVLMLSDCKHTPHRDQAEKVLAAMAEFVRGLPALSGR
ncbi:MAG TPA: alpha/beta hydrolase [Candidatus Sulfotelmatobacter sp.]|nr:alpha/beta hydrolase [Candidatus Sulfotelmatobacter sp.]